MNPLSPLRYPGGKAALSAFLEDVVDLNDLRGGKYYEPYAGGAGAALSLLFEGTVSEIFINDMDRRIYSFWNSVLNDPERFCDAIMKIPLTMECWHTQREICQRPEEFSSFELGFAAFFMNRCNRSGVIVGAGPIGGFRQEGKWLMDARFNREGLVKRIQVIAGVSSAIHLFNLDALVFLKTQLPSGLGRKKVLVYLDPPYVEKGKRLYYNAYDQGDHAKVARYLRAQQVLPWVLSYDDTELIRGLYTDQSMYPLPIRYSLQKKRAAQELLIAPDHLRLPVRLKRI